MHFEIGRLNDRYVAYWYEEDRKRVRIRLDASSKNEAKAEGLRVWESYQRANGGGMLMHDLQKRYANYLGDRRTGRQLKQFWKTMGPVIGPYRPEEVSDEVVSGYLEQRQESAIKRRGKPLSNGTLFAEVNMIQNILNYGKKKNIIERCISLEKPIRPAPKDRWLCRPEIDRLLSEMEKVPHLYTATLLMLSTAGRVGAILELTWDRVHFDKDSINLKVGSKDAPRKGRAHIPMNEGLRAHLLDLYERRESDYVVAFRGKSVSSISKAFKAHCRAAGLGDVSPHVLRHTAAVHMVAAGCAMDRVSQYLGHSSVFVTASIYGRFAPEHLVEESKVVDFITKR